MIQLTNITKTVEHMTILNHVSTKIGDGLTFITGASGSGKSSLLRILAGIDQEYEGEVVIGNQSLSGLNSSERSYVLNQKIGFIWQDYKLLDELTVLENLKLPSHLHKNQSENPEKLMIDLNIAKFANKKVKDLSGGQRQRVAIARELMKRPDYLLADEPTSALDKETGKQTMALFRKLAETYNVVIVTHDASAILATDQVIELDKGSLHKVSELNEADVTGNLSIAKNKLMGIKGLGAILKTSIGRHLGRFLTAVLTLALGTALILGASGDKIEESNNNAFDAILATYGEGVLDINLVGSFMGAAGTGADGDNGPAADVNQDISALYKKYKQDERIQFVTYSEPFDDINIKVAGKEYQITSSGNVPVINKILVGRMADGSKNEVVVPESFVKKMGIENEAAIGKEIDFSGTKVSWTGQTPRYHPTQVKAEIVGVINTEMVMGSGEDQMTFDIEDSFFFSEPALSQLLKAANKNINDAAFILRTKSPKDLIAIKDEITAEGIVPMGNFEVVEDMVRLGEQSTEQTNSIKGVITVLVIAMVTAVTFISSLLRRKEYAVFKLNGYDNKNLMLLNISELLLEILVAFGLTLALLPAFNRLSESIFNNKMLGYSEWLTLLTVIGLLGVISLVIREVMTRLTTVMKAFKVGKK